MPACKVCGSWFAKIRDDEVLCDRCQTALGRLNSYVSPVVHGDWIGYFPHCSVCGEEALSKDNGTLHGAYFLTKYCPNCGAKMDGGNQNV